MSSFIKSKKNQIEILLPSKKEKKEKNIKVFKSKINIFRYH